CPSPTDPRKPRRPQRFFGRDIPPPRGTQQKARAVSPGLDLAEPSRVTASGETQATFLKTLPKLSLTGSAESVATFWAIAANSLDLAISASNCLRVCAGESLTISGGDFTVIRWLGESNAPVGLARTASIRLV